MPGIRLAYTLRPDGHTDAPTPINETLARDAGPATPPVYADESLVVGVEQPDGYPFEHIEQSGRLFCIEGHVYAGQRPLLLRSLDELPWDADDEAFASRLQACARAVDGDFVVLYYDRRRGRLGVICDRFSRLPLYWHASNRRVLVSRHQGFVLAHLEAAAIDRTGLAQLLLFGYPLAHRTLVENVRRLLPGEALVASSRSWRLFPPRESPLRRPGGTERPRSRTACARDLRDAFVAGSRARALEGHSHVLSLSGGMDSRTTGAGMRAAAIGFSSVTFTASGSPHPDESATAAGVARCLGADWRVYELDYADPRCIAEIIDQKLGLNPINVGFGLEYVRRLRAAFPAPVALWTGEGANQLLYEHRCIPPRPGLDELVRFILAKNTVWEPRHIAALVDVREDDLLAGVRASVATFDVEPEDAYAYFLLSQRVVRWLMEGEDRNRTAVWPVAPFYDRDFFALARAVPPEWKRGRRMYRELLMALAPDVAAIPLAGGHAAPSSRRFALESALRERLRNHRYASAIHRRLRGRRVARQTFGDVWRAQLAGLLREGAVTPPFDAPAVEQIASGAVPAPWHALALLATAILAARRIQREGKE